MAFTFIKMYYENDLYSHFYNEKIDGVAVVVNNKKLSTYFSFFFFSIIIQLFFYMKEFSHLISSNNTELSWECYL